MRRPQSKRRNFTNSLVPPTNRLKTAATSHPQQLDAMLMLDALLRAHNVQMQAIQADATAAHATITINTLLTDPLSLEPVLSTGDQR